MLTWSQRASFPGAHDSQEKVSLELLKESGGGGGQAFAFKANYIETKQSAYHSGTEHCFPQIMRQGKWALSLTWCTDVPEKD